MKGSPGLWQYGGLSIAVSSWYKTVFVTRRVLSHTPLALVRARVIALQELPHALQEERLLIVFFNRLIKKAYVCRRPEQMCKLYFDSTGFMVKSVERVQTYLSRNSRNQIYSRNLSLIYLNMSKVQVVKL